MNRWIRILPAVVTTAYMGVGAFTSYDPVVMRVVAPALLLIMTALVRGAVRLGASTAIDKTFAVYMALCAGAFIFDPKGLGAAVGRFPTALLYILLFLAAIVPQLTGRPPFTTAFARRAAPRAVWNTDVFKRVNLHLSWAWAAIFAGCTVSALAVEPCDKTFGPAWCLLWEVAVPAVLIVGIGLPLSKHYPRYYLRKLGLRPMAVSLGAAAGNPSPSTGRSGDGGSMEDKMDKKKKVVAINGSPHEQVGNTSLMIGMLSKAFAEQGFETEEVFLNNLNIRYCAGCATCIEKGSCWIKDDHKPLMKKILDADVVVLASPVYFHHVTAQMKTFLDRSLSWGHKPPRTYKPGLAVSVSAIFGEISVAEYLGRLLPVYGAFEVGRLTALASGPGEFLGKEHIELRAADLVRDVVRVIKEDRRYPANEHQLAFWHIMGSFIREHRDFMKSDYRYWEENGLYESFEAFVQQTRSPGITTPEMRKAWMKELIQGQDAGPVTLAEGGTQSQAQPHTQSGSDAESPSNKGPASARELLEMMPSALDKEAAKGLSAVYQFEVKGDENFTAHLRIDNCEATFVDGPAEKPDVIVKTPAAVWIAIARGEEDGAHAFMSGKYTVEGDLGLLMKLNTLFR